LEFTHPLIENQGSQNGDLHLTELTEPNRVRWRSSGIVPTTREEQPQEEGEKEGFGPAYSPGSNSSTVHRLSSHSLTLSVLTGDFQPSIGPNRMDGYYTAWLLRFVATVGQRRKGASSQLTPPCQVTKKASIQQAERHH
jgi:hypothetical protein